MLLQVIKKQRNLYSIALLLLLGMIWGTGYSIAKFATSNNVSPLGYGFWQSIGPAFIILCLSLLKKEHLKLDKQHLTYYAVCGITGIALPNTIMYFAASHLPAGILAIAVNTVPIFTYPLALGIGLENFNWRRMAGVTAAIAGVMFIIIPTSTYPSVIHTPWLLISLLAPASFACCSIYIARNRPEHTSAFPLTAGMLIFSSLVLTPLVVVSHQFHWLSLSMPVADQVIVLEIVLSSIGYLLFFQLIKIAGPVFYSMVDSIVVITGLFWGYMIFGETLNRWTFVAVYFILMALILVTKPAKKPVEFKLVTND